MNLIATSKDSKTATSTQTLCPYCGVGCGVEVVQDIAGIRVRGDRSHPANAGRLCVKGSALHETVSLEGRLLTPMIEGKPASWDAALTKAADYFKKVIEEHGPDAVAFYLSGQLLTEDYYVANKLMKGFIGSANVDTNSRLCMASAVVAHKRAFGADAVPGCYEDLEKTDVIFFVGSNAAYAHPIVFQRIAKTKKERGTKVVVIDPRRTATCDIADLHIPLKAGSDAFFYNGLLVYLADNHKLDKDFIETHCEGFDEALAVARSQTPSVEVTAKLCDVSFDALKLAYELFAAHEKVVTLFSQGINQSSSGVDKGNAIINCHLVTAKIGREGAAPFSITGQPNAMGGREVGGLANQLAAHMSFERQDIDVVGEFWKATRMANSEGLKAVDLFESVSNGKIKAIWIMGTNPVVSMPNANKVKAALDKCGMVVVSDCMADTDTTRCANILLPATTWGEKRGTVTNSERTISLQKPFLEVPGEAKHDWEIISAFANKLGFKSQFNYKNTWEIFKEHAALSGFKSDLNVKRAFNISGYANITKSDYETLTPRQWPITDNHTNGTRRLFSDGQFYTANRKANIIAITARLPMVPATDEQFIMNTGRIRDQWHTMTRTGKASRLLAHTSEPFVEINPDDAKRLSIENDDLVECLNLGYRFIGKARLTNHQRPGDLFIPMHWNSIFASQGRAGVLINDIVDPICGQPEFKHSPILVKKYHAEMYGLLISKQGAQTIPCDYWSKITLKQGAAYCFSHNKINTHWETWIKAQFSQITDWVTLTNEAIQSINNSDENISNRFDYRALGFVNDCLEVAFIIAPKKESVPHHEWLANQLGNIIPLEERFTMLAGQAENKADSPGPIVCSCFQVGLNQINTEIENGSETVEALGNSLKCGTNCGSCIPELSSLLRIRNESKRGSTKHAANKTLPA